MLYWGYVRLYKGFVRVFWGSVRLYRICTSHITSIESQDNPYITPKQALNCPAGLYITRVISPQYCNLRHYNVEWRSMEDTCSEVVILTPRFGWKHNFSLPLHKVCWRKADHLGNTDDYWTHEIKSQTAFVSPQALSRLSRCAQMLDHCHASLDAGPEEMMQLRQLFPVASLWPGLSRSHVYVVGPTSRCAELLAARWRAPHQGQAASTSPGRAC